MAGDEGEHAPEAPDREPEQKHQTEPDQHILPTHQWTPGKEVLQYTATIIGTVAIAVSKWIDAPYFVFTVCGGLLFIVTAVALYAHKHLPYERSKAIKRSWIVAEILTVVVAGCWLAHVIAPPFDVSLMTAHLSIDGIVVAYESQHGQTVSPIGYITKLKVTNRQSVATLIDGWSVEGSARQEGPWTKLNQVPLSPETKVYFCATLDDCELTDVADDRLDLTQTIESHASKIGWLVFQCPNYAAHCPYWFLRVSLYSGVDKATSPAPNAVQILSFWKMQQGPPQGVNDTHSRFFNLVPHAPHLDLKSAHWAVKFGE
jgi:hypothetical protein